MTIARTNCAAVVALALGAACAQPVQESHKSSFGEKGRSVVVVTIDTTRPDHLSPYGAKDVATPVMQRLADEGITFERAWAVAPITLVAHTTMLSGLNPFEHGVRNNGIQYVPDTVTTIAERLKVAEYQTGAFVSAAVLETRYGLDQGFDVYDDDLSKRRNHGARMVADRPAENTVDSALAWLDGLSSDRPYFLWVHFYDPHANYSPPPPYRDTFRTRPYDGEIAYMDAQLGRLLEHARIKSETNAPVVTVIADHGESFGEHGEKTHAILAYDSTLHIPWFLSVPGGPKGKRYREPVGQVDLVPTLLSLVGLDPTLGGKALPGRDLTPFLEGRKQEEPRAYYSETYLPYYTYGWAKLRVLHRGWWKYIDAPTPELYNRRQDPRELSNIQSLEGGIAHDMRRDLDEWLSQFDADQEATLALDDEDIAALASLGYVSVGSGKAQREGPRPNPMEMIEHHVGLERARALLGDRMYGPAVRQLRKVLNRDPHNLSATTDLMRALEGLGDLDEAARVGKRALELDPDYIPTYMQLARLEAKRENVDQAIKLSQAAIDRDPQRPETCVQKAALLQRVGRLANAQSELTAALKRHPDNPRVNAMYAFLVELRKGHIDEAEARLSRVVEKDPYYEQGWLFLGRVQERQRKVEDAEASYRSGLATRPNEASLHGALGQLLARRGEAERAIPRLQESIRLSEEPRSELYVSLGGALADVGRFLEAKREYKKALDLNPKHAGARNNLAVAHFRMGEANRALHMLRQLVKEFPQHADAHNNLAAIAVESQKWNEVVRHSRKTIALSPDLVEGWNNLGIGLEETNRTQKAVEAYEKAITLDESYWPARFNLGFLLKKQGKARQAIDAFSEVVERVPHHGEAHLELGELFSSQEESKKQAKTHWNAFLKHAPKHPRGSEIRNRLSRL